MARSMTSYGQGQSQAAGWLCEATIRSVNSRYLEMKLSLPKNLEREQGPIRGRIQEQIQRGMVNVRITFNRLDNLSRQVELHEAAVAAYIEDMSRISGLKRENLKAEHVLTLLTLPDVYTHAGEQIPLELAQELYPAAMAEALEHHRLGALREGSVLLRAMEEDLDELLKAMSNIEEALPNLEKAYRDRLRSRLAMEIEAGSWDESRLLQEILLFVDKTDVAEELVRLKSHRAALSDILAHL